MKNLWKERKSLSYQSLNLADVNVCPVVVHRRLAPSVVPVPLYEGYELRGHPPLAHCVLGLRIFDEPIDLPLKLVLLGQVDVMRLTRLYRLLQHLRVVQCGRYKAGVFDGILYHFSCGLVEDNVNHFYANAFRQMKIFMCAREN
jgi:hypothetical protein